MSTSSSNARIAVIDYGMGNIRSVLNALDEVNADATLVSAPEEVAGFDKVLLPGVGAFAEAMEHLRSTAMDEALDAFVRSGRELLGICLGMQLVCRDSDENGSHDGLGWVDARVRAFPRDMGLKVPHMGWNAIHFSKASPLLDGLDSGLDVYFVHSFRVEIENQKDQLASTDYGQPFTSMVQVGNVCGMQFHPEKSQSTGLRLLHNFCHHSLSD